jgi:hypothetical protein
VPLSPSLSRHHTFVRYKATYLLLAANYLGCKAYCRDDQAIPGPFFEAVPINLPDEAILRGPVQYGWMYPVERRLYTLKHSVRNMARPEGSIVEAYVTNECLHACSRYFDDLETRHNREGRNREHVDMSKGDLFVFQHGVDLLGAPTIKHIEKDYYNMVWYVLNNCVEAEPYIEYVFTLCLLLPLISFVFIAC